MFYRKSIAPTFAPALGLALLFAATPAAQAAPAPDYDLNHARSVVTFGLDSRVWQGVGTQTTDYTFGSGFRAHVTGEGTTTGYPGSAMANVHIEKVGTSGGGNHRSASTYTKLEYYVSILPIYPEYAELDSINLALTTMASRIGGDSQSNTGTQGYGRVRVTNILGDQTVVDYNTDDEAFFDDPFYNGEKVTNTYYLDGIPTNAVFHIELTALAEAIIDPINNTSAFSEVWVDPLFEFDQAAYDLARLSDENLPDIQLADYFYFGISPGMEVSPVPVPAAAWLFGSALMGLAGVGRRRRT
ncbi:VPLPA-CTERM sorting domain-containing protein [Mangrovimicrobium sediminis]|uniref:VPLPA-CTERM sorting domain-containing protein n=1 Tax=Mangrovimicrobium sediminis TaxID=2562682 RepID=UPI00197D8DCB|nr:VPLPA-CTERM sorting domain-containing protein [Haliea sp. SAOS-164]